MNIIYMTEKFMGVHMGEEEVESFKDIARKERKSLKSLHKEIIQEYIKIHADGNPAFTLDQFIEDPGMKAVPAFYRNRDDWINYIENLPKKEAQNILWQAQTINSLAEKKVHHGTVHVRYH